MFKAVFVLGALVLGFLGINGLLKANPSSQTDFIVAGVELIGAIVLIGLAFVLGKGEEAPAAVAPPESDDRAEVIERLHRHTAALRVADQEPVEPATKSAASDSMAAHDAGSSSPAKPEVVHDAAPAASAAPAEPSAGGGTTPYAPAVRFTTRLPSLMLLNVDESATIADIETAPPLGARDTVLERLRDIVPDLEVDEKGQARHSGPDHSIRLDLGSRAEVHTVVVEAAGRTGVSLVRWFLESTGWRAFAPKLGRFVEPDALDSVVLSDE